MDFSIEYYLYFQVYLKGLLQNLNEISKNYNELLNYDVGAVNKLSSYGRRFLNQKSF